jgi:hypothetical protein
MSNTVDSIISSHWDDDSLPEHLQFGPKKPVTTQPEVESKATSIKTNEEHWISFEEQIDDFAVAKSVVDFLDENPEEKIKRQGLYLKACITLKRGAIAYQEAKKATEDAQKQAEASERALKLKKAQMQDPHYVIELAFKKLGSFLTKPEVLGVGLALSLLWIIKH